MITIAQAAALVGCSTRWIQTLIARGDLSAQRITSRLYLVDLDETRKIIEQCKARGKGQPRKTKEMGK